MTNLVLLFLIITLTSVSLLVTCTRMGTDMTTEASKDTKALDTRNTKILDDSKATENDTNTENDVDLMAVMTMCNETFRIEMSFLVSLNESGSFPDETDKTPKCFLRCVLQTLEIASMDDGKIDPERAAAIFADARAGEDVGEIASFCAQRDEKCHCEMAYNFLKCLFSMEIEINNKKSKS